MNHVERIAAALDCRETDKVPRGEFKIEEGLVTALLGCKAPVGFSEAVAARALLGMDFLAVEPSGSMLDCGNGYYRDLWGRVIENKSGILWVKSPALSDIKEVAAYTLPHPEEFSYEQISLWRDESDFFVFAFIDGPFQGTGRLFDFTEFLMAVAHGEAAVGELCAKVVEFNLEMARFCRQAGAHGIIIGDDIAYKRGTYVHPETWQQTFLPHLETLVKGLKDLGLPVVYHSDGNLNAVLHNLAGLPINGLQCMEPTAGMDINFIKKKYGRKLCLIGNFNMELLATGTPAVIAAAVEELLSIAAPGGGYIFSTSSGILNAGLPVQNVLALYEALKVYGG